MSSVTCIGTNTAEVGHIAINQMFAFGQVTGHRSALLGPTQVTSDLLLSIKVFRIGRVTSHRSSLLGANTADIGLIAINQVIPYWPSYRSSVSFIRGQYSRHRPYCYFSRYFVLAKLKVIGQLYLANTVNIELMLSITVFRICQVTGHRSALLGPIDTADIGPIAFNQGISYWPSYRSSVSCIEADTDDLLSVSGPI